jgi:hypothetical protein
VTTGLVSAIDAGLEPLKIHLPVPRLDLCAGGVPTINACTSRSVVPKAQPHRIGPTRLRRRTERWLTMYPMASKAM